MTANSIKSVESITQEGVRANEDCLLVDKDSDLFAVFDGASSLVPYRSPQGKTGALEAAEIACDTFAQNPALDLEACTKLANIAIEARHHELGIDVLDNVNRFSCTVAAAKVQDQSVFLLQNSDSIVIVEDKQGNVSPPLGYFDQDLEIMKKWRHLADAGCTNIRELVSDDVIDLRSKANHAFGVLNGDPKALDMCKTTTLALANIASLLIITDGLFIPKSDPEANDNWQQYIEICKKTSLSGLLKVVRDIENSDPELMSYPRYKKHDDATGIFIVFGT